MRFVFAREKFKLNQRVRMSREGIKSNILPPGDSGEGIVVGFPPDPQLVKIRLDGRLSADVFHVYFFNPIRSVRKKA